MSLLAKRHQQAVFNAANALNKAAGTGGGSGFLVKQLLAKVVNIGGQTLAGTGAEVTISTVPLLLPRTGSVELVAIVAGLANHTPGVFSQACQVYLKIDGTASTQTIGYLPRYGAVGAGQYGSQTTLLEVDILGAGSHTATLVWLSDSANDTLHDYSDSLFAFQLGA